MTAYFDRKHEQLNILAARYRKHEDYASIHEALEIEGQMLFEVNLVCTLPGFPSDITDGIQLTIAAYSTEPLGFNFRDEDDSAIFSRLNNLVFDLHTHFHDLVHKNLGYSDSPKSCLEARANIMEDRRLSLMRNHTQFAEYMSRYDVSLGKIEAQLKEP